MEIHLEAQTVYAFLGQFTFHERQMAPPSHLAARIKTP